MTILITGGTGFVGFTLALEILKREKEKIVLFDVNPPKVNLSEQNKKNIDVVLGDIRNFNNLLETCKNFEINKIVHMAAIANGDIAEKDPYRAYEVNVSGTSNICEISRKLDIDKTIFISSGAVYGKQKGPISENSEYKLGDFYSATKIMGETISLQYVKSYSINLFINRLYFIYGPRMFFEPLNPLFIVKNAVEGRSSVFERGGDQLWDFTYVTDTAHGIELTLFAKKTQHRIFNISSGHADTFYQVGEMVKKQIPEAHIKIGPGDAGIPRGAPLDISRAKKELGYEPKISLEEGIKRLITWLKTAK